MPLAFGSLLGGLTTQIGTPPNILVSEALRDAGLESFTFFDFTPVGLAIMFCGVAVMVLIGRRLLPQRDVAKELTQTRTVDWESQYDLGEQLFNILIPHDSLLINKTLAESRLGSALGWNVIGIIRENRILPAPGPTETLQAGDQLTVEGSIEELQELKNWQQLIVEKNDFDSQEPYFGEIEIGEVAIAGNSQFIGKTLNSIGFRGRFEANVLAIRRGENIRRTHLQDIPLQPADVLLVAGHQERLEKFHHISGFDRFKFVPRSELMEIYNLHERLIVMKVPPGAAMIGKTLKESRLGGSLGSRVLGILRGDDPILMPEPWETLQADDRLLIEGRMSDFEILKELEKLSVEKRTRTDLKALVSGNIGMVEAILSPHTMLVGTTLRQLNFREKYGLSVLAIWREGKAYRSGLRDMALQFGDALLLYGPQKNLQMLGGEPDFIVLTGAAQEELRLEKMKFSVSVMIAILVPVIIGWVPIYIAAVIGAALMVLFGCLSMDEAYRQIEWKAVFLIAGLLPLGTALDQTGAARLIAEGVVTFVGPLGPRGVLLGLVSLTFLATCFVPTAALVVLMAPIVLSTSTNMGLSPDAFMMAIAMAASASFMTPISHPANILVMGPGGYRFMDFFKVGGLLTLVVLAVIMFILPLFWPLTR